MTTETQKEDKQIAVFRKVTNETIQGIESDLAQIAKDFGEIALDLNLDPGLLKDIPLVRTAAGVASLIGNVRDAFFALKLKRVFESSNKEQRQKLSERLKSDEKFATRVVQKFLLLIDRTIDMEKSELLGKIIAAFAEEKIDQDTLMRLFDAVDRLFVPDLPIFMRFHILKGSTDQFIKDNHHTLQNLVMCGLVDLTYRGGRTPISASAFATNPLGSQLISIIQDGQDLRGSDLST